MSSAQPPPLLRVVLSVALALFSMQASALGQTEPWPVKLRGQLVRLGNIEYALRSATGTMCKIQESATGIKFDYIEAYAQSQRELVRSTTGLANDVQIIAVAPSSPAAQSGLLPGDNIKAVNGIAISRVIADSPTRGLVADEVEDILAASPAGRAIVLVVARGDKVLTFHVMPKRLCAVRLYLKTDEGLTAYGDERSVAVGRKFLDFMQNDDELAMLAGHEIAHIAAGDDISGSLKIRRGMEDRADLLGADIGRCAGYDMNKGLDMWRRFNARDWLRWFRAPTHRKLSERIERIADHLSHASKSCPPAVPALFYE